MLDAVLAAAHFKTPGRDELSGLPLRRRPVECRCYRSCCVRNPHAVRASVTTQYHTVAPNHVASQAGSGEDILKVVAQQLLVVVEVELQWS